ncbi:MAG: glucose 1-dehydrogenase [Deltaproteobacteria bacterium]|nr:glucose 1-dehydrogenase [Deltaproteobacteria bacterium]
MTPRFTNKIVLITGAGSGIGRATALRFASEGAQVGVIDRREAASCAVVAEIKASGGRAVAGTADVTQAADCARVVAEVIAAFGPIDILVNNAGIGHSGTILETDEPIWDAVMDVNVKGMFLMSKAVLPAMIERGAGVIVNTASVAGVKAVPDRLVYTTSKFAVVGFTRAMALDHVRQGIRVNCVCPGTTETPWIDERLAQSPDAAKARAALISRQPMGRMGKAEEMAGAIVYLASDDAAFATGTALVIDGGLAA